MINQTMDNQLAPFCETEASRSRRVPSYHSPLVHLSFLDPKNDAIEYQAGALAETGMIRCPGSHEGTSR